MALRRVLSRRLLCTAITDSPPPALPPGFHFRRDLFTATPNSSAGFFRRFLQRRHISDALPSFLTLPVGEELRERIRSMSVSSGSGVRLDGLRPPPSPEKEGFRVDAADARRVLMFVQMEKIRERLRNIPASTIPYDEFVRICGGDGACGSEFAKALDESGNVIVLGGVVFLHPDQVAKSMERLISQSISMPNDPRKKELDNLENQKTLIDQKARSMVRGELYCGLGFMIVQTLGFMRLTFWELSWDVMEPICFFVTSAHFALAYAFFLKTSKEPSFEGYFQRRFKAKQKKLIKIHKFDMERYNQLCETFYPFRMQHDYKNGSESLDHGRGVVFGSVHG